MAIKQSVEAPDGREIEGAYWTPAQINIGVFDETGQITFYGHVSAEARAQRKAPIAGAVKNYPFSRAQFLAAQTLKLTSFFAEWKAVTLRTMFPDQFPADDPRGDLTLAQMVDLQPHNTFYDVLGRFTYGTAYQTKDTAVTDAEGKPVLGPDVPVLDGEGKPVLDGKGEPMMQPGPALMRSFFEGSKIA